MAMLATVSAIISPFSTPRNLPQLRTVKSEEFWSEWSCCSSRKRGEGVDSDLIVTSTTPNGEDSGSISESISLTSNSPSDGVAELVEDAQSGLTAGMKPSSLDDGSAGVYLFSSSSGEDVAVFKPGEEEAGCDLNPKGNSPKSASWDGGAGATRAGVAPGTSMYREVAAYLLDKDGFVGVPHTAMVDYHSDSGVKTGSIQSFVHSRGSAGDMGASLFPVSDVQRLAMLDLRLLNLDRHDGNILVKSVGAGLRLVPIDHGYVLPSHIEVSTAEWCWYSWAQAKQPILPEVKDYILALDADADAATLAAHNVPISSQALRVSRIMTHLLQAGVRCDLSLYDLATLAARDVWTEPSALEKAVRKGLWRALAKVNAGVDEAASDRAAMGEVYAMIDELVKGAATRNSACVSSAGMRAVSSSF